MTSVPHYYTHLPISFCYIFSFIQLFSTLFSVILPFLSFSLIISFPPSFLRSPSFPLTPSRTSYLLSLFLVGNLAPFSLTRVVGGNFKGKLAKWMSVPFSSVMHGGRGAVSHEACCFGVKDGSGWSCWVSSFRCDRNKRYCHLVLCYASLCFILCFRMYGSVSVSSR